MPVWYTIFTTSEVPADRVRLLADRIATAYASTEAQILAKRAGLEIEPRGLEDTKQIYLQTISTVADTLSGLRE
jgi:tripartite-type tricarboxylate transporter receptor subunit TctC